MPIRETFSNTISWPVTNEYDRGAVMQISTVFGHFHHIHSLSKYPLKRNFLDIYVTTFSESITSTIQNLWGASFFSKCLKFNVDFNNAAKNWEKVFCVWDNVIWVGVVKLSLWIRRYFSLEANVLTSIHKISYVNKRDFLKLNFLGRHWWIWSSCCVADFNSAWADFSCSL